MTPEELEAARALVAEVLKSYEQYGPPRLSIESHLVKVLVPKLLELVDKQGQHLKLADEAIEVETKEVRRLQEQVNSLQEDLQDPTRDEWRDHARYVEKENRRLQERVRAVEADLEIPMGKLDG